MKYKYFYAVLCLALFLGQHAVAQIVHNLEPVEYQQLSETERVQSFIFLMEQRVKLHDCELGGLLFDSLVCVQGDSLTREEVDGRLFDSFTYCGMSDSLLYVDYMQKPGGFKPLFTVLEAAPARTLDAMQIGDTITINMTIQTGTTDTIRTTSIRLKKLNNLDLLPIRSYAIVDADPTLFQWIAVYSRNYIVDHVGTRGEISAELNNMEWADKWDFHEDDPKPCVTPIYQYKIVDGVYKQIPIVVEYEGEPYSFPELTRNLVFENINRNLIGYIMDFRAYVRSNTLDCFLTVCDVLYNRMLTLDLASMSIKAMPGAREGMSWGPTFVKLSSMWYNRVISKLYCYDHGDYTFKEYDYAANENAGYTNENECGEWAEKISPSQFAKPLTLFGGPGTPTWGPSLWTSDLDGSTSGISVYRGGQREKRLMGFNTRCGIEKFEGDVEFEVSDFYLPATKQGRISAEFAEYMLVSDSRHVAVVSMDTSMHSPYEMTSVKPHRLYTFPEMKSGFSTLERSVDGIMINVDERSNLIHVFEPIDGMYLYSTRPAQYDDGSGKMKIARNVKQNWSTRTFFLEDVYISRDWGEFSGISRFLPTGKVVEAKITNLGAGYSEVTFTTTSRTRLSIVLIDSAYNEYTCRGPVFVNAGIQKVALFNPNSMDVGIKYLPASNANYRNYSVADSIIILSTTGIPRTIAGRNQRQEKNFSIHIWPSPASYEYYIRVAGWSGGYANISITDLVGRRLYHEDAVYLPEGESTITRYLPAYLPRGVYIISIAGDKSTQTTALIRN